MSKPTKPRIALDESLLAVDPNDPNRDGLKGNRCPECDLTFFPKRQYCSKCCQPVDGEVILPRHGKLETYSTMTRKPPYAVIEAPYVLGQVDTGPASVVSVIQARAEDLSVGMAVELVSESLKEDEDGNQLVTYYFRPSAGT